MNRIIIFVLIIITLLPTTYAFNTNTDFNKDIYYGETINLGISNISSLEVIKVTISIFSIYENYFSNTYDISEAEDIPIVFDDQVYFNSKINYKLLDINDNIIEEQEFDINLIENQDISDFYLCNQPSCTAAEIPVNYDFWIDEDIYLNSEIIDNNKFQYNITIETDIEQENQTLLFVENTQLPYLIPNNSIAGSEYYKITIEIIEKQTNKLSFKNTYFSLSELTEEEHREIMNEILYPKEEIEDNNTQTENAPRIIQKDEITQESTAGYKPNYILITVIAIIVILLILLLTSKPKTNRRLSRRQKK